MQATVYTMLLLLDAQPQWLNLSRKKREQYFSEKIQPIFSRYSETVQVRFFDSEYFHGRISDFLIAETSSLNRWAEMMEELRDSEIYAVPYFKVVELITGVENGFQRFGSKTESHEM